MHYMTYAIESDCAMRSRSLNPLGLKPVIKSPHSSKSLNDPNIIKPIIKPPHSSRSLNDPNIILCIDGEPTGNFYLDEIGARKAAFEMLGTRKGMVGREAKQYM